MNCYKFYINKYVFVKDEIPDLSFIPMLMRRKLDNFGKAALYSLYNVYEQNKQTKLIFASCYGDIERVKKLINQRQEEGEISPTGFSFSVHNATIGLFSLLNSIKSSYNSISAGKDTLTNALLEAVLDSKTDDVIFCYTENNENLESLALSISKEKQNENSIEITIDFNKKGSSNSFDNIISFLKGETTSFTSNLYSLERG
ncbi:MAG: beta-ketoacyl synthase chain length factor [Candidatus Gastranaerophilales bacterium]|nr:beta-ketoacyl synthase chain length factor [Candidatus Gastranaerophilales bacterium]